MKFNTDAPLIDRKGEQIKDENGTPLTHGIIAVRALDATIESDRGEKPDAIRKRFNLANYLMCGGVRDLKPEDIVMIQSRLTIFGTIVGGQVILALDGRESSKAA